MQMQVRVMLTAANRLVHENTAATSTSARPSAASEASRNQELNDWVINIDASHPFPNFDALKVKVNGVVKRVSNRLGTLKRAVHELFNK
jgi:hypothetical protein